MLFHRRIRRHAVKEFVFASILHDYLTAALIVSGEQTADHDKVSAGTERLCDIA
jgi:hypothetical protein